MLRNTKITSYYKQTKKKQNDLKDMMNHKQIHMRYVKGKHKYDRDIPTF